MLPPWEFRSLSNILVDIAPFFGCTKNFAQATFEVVYRLPRQPAVELSAEEALQFFTREVAKLPSAECRNEMHVEHVLVMLLRSVLERRQNHRHPVIFSEIAKGAEGLRSRLAAVD